MLYGCTPHHSVVPILITTYTEYSSCDTPSCGDYHLHNQMVAKHHHRQTAISRGLSNIHHTYKYSRHNYSLLSRVHNANIKSGYPTHTYT